MYVNMLFSGYMGCISNVWFSTFGLSVCSVWIQYFLNESTLFGVVYSMAVRKCCADYDQ